jgi:hypothetical protein
MRIRMIIGIPFLLPLAPASGLASARPVGAPPPWCVSTSDSTAGRMIIRLSWLDTLPEFIEVRARLDSLPQVPADQIQMVGDEALCQRASQALDSAFFETPQQSAVYLARYGSAVYFAFPPSYQKGEYHFLVHLDSAFTVRRSFTW